MKRKNENVLWQCWRLSLQAVTFGNQITPHKYKKEIFIMKINGTLCMPDIIIGRKFYLIGM